MRYGFMIPRIVWPHRLDLPLSLCCAALAVTVVAIVIVLTARTRRRARSRPLAESESLAVLQQLQRLHVLVSTLDGRVQALTPLLEGSPPLAGATANFQIAVRLARAGANRQELSRGCGLTYQEAELVARLHGPQTGETHGLVAAA